MTHNIQIGVNVDDQSIERAIVQAAVAEVTRSCFPRASMYCSDWSGEFRKLMTEAIDKMLGNVDVRGAIINIAAETLATKMARSKNVRDKIVEQIDDVHD